LVLDALIGVTDAEGDLALMVKPQFEVGRERVGKGGVVRDPAMHVEAVRSVVAAAVRRGWGIRDVVTSPLPGPSGNVEFFVWLRRGPSSVDDARIRAVVSAGPASAPGERVDG
jgi:23S rRNA (cytidine1920-2'-O)/16S rRNA (cytidine1409-2'-O)-methyltransferase